jgi:phosphoribosyl-AMP cyclohydrolase
MAFTNEEIDEIVKTIKFNQNPAELAPAVIQNAETNEVLMVGFMNPAALRNTLETGNVTFWSRSRQELWVKGLTSGNFLKFVTLRTNCNQDSVLVLANPIGPTCHTGFPTCYYREAEGSSWKTIGEPLFDPDVVYKKK